MKVLAFLFFTSLWLIHVRNSSAEYMYRPQRPRQPGPPMPPMPQYAKKWFNPHHRRPIPVPPQMSAHYKKPLGPPIPKRVPPVPARATKVKFPHNWSNGQNPIRPTLSQEKPFLSSPIAKLPEYDFHLQTNQIPNQVNLIKQIDEKGPIHTIPAPNLSPADKPHHVEIIPQQQLHHHPQQQQSIHQQLQLAQHEHQLPQQHQFAQQQISQHQHISQSQHQHHPKTIVEIQKSHQYQVTENSEPKKFYYQQQFPINPNEKMQQINYPQNDNPGDNQIHHQQPQQIFNFPPQQQLQNYYNPPQISAYTTQIQHHGNDFVQPDYQTFNYVEPTQKEHALSAEYSLQSDEIDPRHPSQTLEQSQFVLNFYNPNNDNNNNDNINNSDNEEIMADGYYSSLPNKEAADALATLQEAGKQSGFMNENEENKQRTESDRGYDYDYASQEDSMGQAQEDSFGSRIKPKNY